MAQITITEALQEIKTINLRLEKKRNGIMPYVARDNRARDPFESSGGSAKHVKQERQSIADLEKRIVSIRSGIQASNLSSKLTIGNETQSVSDWLTWRREVSAGQLSFVSKLVGGIQSVRAQMQQKGGRVTAIASAEVNLSQDAPPEAIVSVDERELLAEQDHLQTVLGTLDGRLSLFNATTTIDI
jgi:hypothetical protein